MIKYRDFLSLTDEEIEFILTDIFHPTKIENIQRYKEFNEITADITTGGWNDGEIDNFEVTDEITLSITGMEVDFSLCKGDELKWKQFLLAKGCDYRLKDNPYFE